MCELAAYGFDLNPREIAILIYTLAFFGWALLIPSVRRSAGDVVKAFFQRQILVVLVAMSAFVIACVLVLAHFDVWRWVNLKTTIVWWMTFAFVSMFEASKVSEEPGTLKRMAWEALNITTVIVFIAEFQTFPLWGEMLFVPFVTMVALMLGVAQHRPENAIVVGPLTVVQSLVGFGVLGFGLFSVIQDFREFASLDTAREFAVPVLLSLMFLPFLYCLSVVMVHETIFVSLRFQKENDRLVRYAQRKAILSFGLDVDGIKRLARSIRMDDIEDRAGVDGAVREIKRLKKRERNPPFVPPSGGWSPYEARRFLEEHGIVTRDYHRSFDDWWAEAPSVKLGDRPLPDHVSYYVSGTEGAATRLRLALDASYQNDPVEADGAFFERVETLLGRVFGEERVPALLERLLSADEQEFEIDGKRLSLERHEWGIAQRGGYGRNFKILHEAHVPTDFD